MRPSPATESRSNPPHTPPVDLDSVHPGGPGRPSPKSSRVPDSVDSVSAYARSAPTCTTADAAHCCNLAAVPVCIGRRCSGLGASAVTSERVLEVVRVVRREAEQAHERFLRHVRFDEATACWCWTAHRDSDGYGRVWFDGRDARAPRVAWALWRGELRAGDHVLHTRCSNRACVNPWHVRAGSNLDNVADREAAGRGVVPVRPRRERKRCASCGTALGVKAWQRRSVHCRGCRWTDETRDARLARTRAWSSAGVAARRGEPGGGVHLQSLEPPTPPGVLRLTRRNVGIFVATEGRCPNVREPHRQRVYCRETTLAFRSPRLPIGTSRCS